MKYKYTTPPISTDNKELEVGKLYCYKEDSYIGQVKFIQDKSDEKFESWEFEWTIPPHGLDSLKGQKFVCSSAILEKPFYYSGMLRIYDDGAYLYSGQNVRDYFANGDLWKKKEEV
jgi:hypothetical protein